MREYGQIQSGFWANPEIQALSDWGKLLAAYLLTSPHTNGIGCFRMPFGYVSEDFGKGFETVSKGFQELFEKGFLGYCEETKFVVIWKFLKWNPISNPNVAKSRQKEFDAVPKKFKYYKELCQEVAEYGTHMDNPFETLSEPFRNPFETRPEPEKNQKGPRKEPDDSSEPETVSKPPGDPPPDEPPVIEIPLNDKTEFPITQGMVAEFAALYPAVDVLQGLRDMRGWSIANPSKRKTRSGVMKFVNAWLAREQNAGGKVKSISGRSTTGETPQQRAQRLAAEHEGNHAIGR